MLGSYCVDAALMQKVGLDFQRVSIRESRLNLHTLNILLIWHAFSCCDSQAKAKMIVMHPLPR